MSLVKGKRQENTILDFSEPKTSKNKIKESLRSLNIVYARCYKNNLTIFDNHIKVGNYSIKLVLNDRYDCQPKKLREFGRFQIRLFEQDKEINISKDYRFKKQQWIKDNINHQLKIKDLVDTIIYCGKLNKLKLFL
jgi:hypothetical protein